MAYIQTIVHVLRAGGIIAYPTEAVYGLGCDFTNERAVMRLLQLKKRSVNKGLILIAASWQQVEPLVKHVADELLKKVLVTWPGPATWIFPATEKVPNWITGESESVAVRVTAHPIARAICEEYGQPIVSTSANITGFLPARSYQEVVQQFGDEINFIVEGEVGDLQNPTVIRDVITGELVRA